MAEQDGLCPGLSSYDEVDAMHDAGANRTTFGLRGGIFGYLLFVDYAPRGGTKSIISD